MRHKRKSPLSADFSFGEYSTSLNTCEDSADSPYVIQRAVMQAMDEEFYHKSHYYLPRRCRVRLYDRQGKVIHQSESVVLGARLPRIYSRRAIVRPTVRLSRCGSSRSIARLLCLWDSVIGPSEPR